MATHIAALRFFSLHNILRRSATNRLLYLLILFYKSFSSGTLFLQCTDLDLLLVDEAELTVIKFSSSRRFPGGHDGSHAYPVHAAQRLFHQHARTDKQWRKGDNSPIRRTLFSGQTGASGRFIPT